MKVQQAVETKIADAFRPAHLEVTNESHMHNVAPGSESHFRLLVVSDVFEGKTLVQRHQAVYGALAAEMKGAIHALGLQTLTPREWEARDVAPLTSPPCRGGDGTLE